MNALIISSQVIHGSVGGIAARAGFAAAGVTARLMPTVVLSNHPGHGAYAGQTVPKPVLTAMIDALDDHGWLAGIDAIVSGYLKTAAQADAVLHALDKVRDNNADAIYCCDPVMGDEPDGLYVTDAVKQAISDKLAPRADILTPNLFELAVLARANPNNRHQAATAARGLHAATVLITSAPSRKAKIIETLVVEGSNTHVFEIERYDAIPRGTGDLLTGLFAGFKLNGSDAKGALDKAGRALTGVVSASRGRVELNLTVLGANA